MNTIIKYSKLVKISHTIFALPFALIGFFLAAKELNFEINWINILFMILCMFFARNSAMSFNRIIDRKYDELNPRTSKREIPKGDLSVNNATIFTIINIILFIVSCIFINKTVLILSPIALFLILFYSYTKRFTFLCHYFLGVALSVSPIGAFLVLNQEISLIPILLAIIVLLWSSGFDIIYSTQDTDFDKNNSLNSIPAKFGIKNSLIISTLTHLPIPFLLITIGLKTEYLSTLYYIGVIIFVLLLIYQHLIVKPKDLSKVNISFSITNGIASLAFSFFFVLDIFL